MAEILVRCVECGNELEEHKTSFQWGCLIIEAIPCQTCLGDREADVRDELMRHIEGD